MRAAAADDRPPGLRARRASVPACPPPLPAGCGAAPACQAPAQRGCGAPAPGAQRLRRPLHTRSPRARPAIHAPLHALRPCGGRCTGAASSRGQPAAAANSAQHPPPATGPPESPQPRPAPAGGRRPARWKRRGRGLLARRGERGGAVCGVRGVVQGGRQPARRRLARAPAKLVLTALAEARACCRWQCLCKDGRCVGACQTAADASPHRARPRCSMLRGHAPVLRWNRQHSKCLK